MQTQTCLSTLTYPPLPDPKKRNITPAEVKALKNLQRNTNIIVKRADKGSCVVIENKSDYIKNGLQHLQDIETYRQLQGDPTTILAENITTYLQKIHDQGHIDQYTKNFLTPPEITKTQRLYFLKKIHKHPHGLRPIVSGCQGATENISSFLDTILQPAVKLIPSYIKNSTEIISILENNPQPSNIILATIDVTSLYTNIPQREGVNACIEALETQPIPLPLDIIRTLLNIVLEGNIFIFNGQVYQQCKGTAMGTKMAPSFANIFMAKLEQKFLSTQTLQPTTWKRYIDDIFCLWPHNLSQLQSFLDKLNNFHPTIKFTWSISNEKATFLDLEITKGSKFHQCNIFDIGTHFKQTNTFQYLHFTSCHPRSVFKGLVKGEAIRLLRSNSDQAKFNQSLKKLAIHFRLRGYPRKLINTCLGEITFNLRENYIKQPTQNTPNIRKSQPPRLIINYTPYLPFLRSILLRHWPKVQEDPALQKVFPLNPQLSYSRNPSLTNKLVRAIIKTTPTQASPVPPIEIPTPQETQTPSCSNPHCKNCQYISYTNYIYSPTKDKRFSIDNKDINCESVRVLYCIQCRICSKLYIGYTQSKTLGEKITQLLYLSLDPEYTHWPLFKHYRDHNTPFVESFKLVPLEITTHLLHQEKEQYWIIKLSTLIPNGLNASLP